MTTDTNFGCCQHEGCCDPRDLGQVRGVPAMHLAAVCDIHMYTDKPAGGALEKNQTGQVCGPGRDSRSQQYNVTS